MSKIEIKNKTVGRIITTIMVVVAVIMLTIVMVAQTSSRTREESLSRMNSVTQEQAMMINDYIYNAEKTLSAFAESDLIYDFLLDQKNAEKKAAAQDYTMRVSDTIDYLEGLWVGSWDTEILCHTNPGAVGGITRPGDTQYERLEALRAGMTNAGTRGEGVYNLGIIKSPVGTNDLIVSLYKAVYNKGSHQPIGFVGLGVYTEALSSSLNSMELNTEGSAYSMISLHDDAKEIKWLTDENKRPIYDEKGEKIPDPNFIVLHRYIFNSDEELVDTYVTDENIISLFDKVGKFDKKKLNYVEKDGKITFYNYMQDREWLFVVESPADEVFSFSKSINRNMILFCLVSTILIIIFNVISIKQEDTLQKLEQSKKKQAAITKNLHVAALKDILTDVNNRIKFIDDYGKDDAGNYKIADCPNSPYCFVMFNLPRFSQINIMYGHDAGDIVLASTADILKAHFGDNVYRTGSDEFVVAVQSTSSNPASIIMEVNGTLSELRRPRSIGTTMLSIAYTAAIVKKSTAITPSVLVTLKDMINNSVSSTDNNAAFVDMDTI